MSIASAADDNSIMRLDGAHTEKSLRRVALVPIDFSSNFR
jgi:hypothetical protein